MQEKGWERMKVYIVTTGCYSAYGIKGIFEKEIDAIMYLDKHEPFDGRIEVWEDTETLNVWNWDRNERKLLR